MDSFGIKEGGRGGPRANEVSNIERFVIIVNGRKPLTIITKHPILDVAAALNPSLVSQFYFEISIFHIMIP